MKKLSNSFNHEGKIVNSLFRVNVTANIFQALQRVLWWAFAQVALISAQDTPQHTFDFQPNYYSFQSIGTNELPPQLAGQFVSTTVAPPPQPEFESEYEYEDLQLPEPSGFSVSNPTGAPVHFFSTTRPMPRK